MSAAMRYSLTSRLAAKARAEAEALAAEVSRRKKAEHQAKQITAAMEEAKKAAAKRREEALERLAKEEAEELRRYEADLAKATKASLGTADAEPDAMDPGARASTDPAPATPAPLDAYIRPTGSAAATGDSKWPPLPRPEAKSEATGRTTATERQPRQRSKSAANKTGDTDTSLSWNDIFANCNEHLRALRGALQDDGLQPPSAAFCRGTRYTVELFGRTRPPLQARANAKPQGKGQFTLDLTWTAIDRDLWPLGSWNKSLGEHGPKPRYEGGKGKGMGLLPERAIWHARNNPEVLELTEADRQLVCRHPPATSARAGHLATELLPRGCYFDPLDQPLRTAVGHWDPDNAIFRCAMVCPACRARACNRRMWYKLDDHDSHLCDSCKD